MQTGGMVLADKFNLQDRFLNQLRVQKVPVKVFLVNGVQVEGKVASFDSFSVMLDSGGKQGVFYKHVISTIVPLAPFSLD